MSTDPRNPQRPEDAQPPEEDFEALLDQYLPGAAPKTKGELVDGTVVAVLDDSVLVSTGSKEEAPIAIAEFTDPRGQVTVAPGDTVRVLLVGWGEDGAPQLSYREARAAEAAKMIAEAHARRVPVRGTISRAVKGGVLVDVGLSAFMPASQVDVYRVGDMQALVGQEIEAYVEEYDQSRNRAVLSRRKLLQERQEKGRREFLDTVKAGDTVKGRVKDVLDFGVFVSLGLVEGLIPRSELSYERGVSPADIVSPGEEIEVKVLEVAPETGKITLSRKRLGQDPWTNIRENYPAGTTVRGRVVAVQPFGAFVQLQEGLTGLIHAKDISWEAQAKSPRDVFQPGDEVTCQVVEIDEEQRRIGLSLKHLARDPWMDVEAKYPVGSRVRGTVASLRDFGAFVRLDEFTEGLLHVGDLSWKHRPKHPGEMLKEGDEIEVMVLRHDSERRRISLGVKQLEESPFDRFARAHPKGSLAKGKVSRLAPFGAFVEFEAGLEGLVHISELDEQRVDSAEKAVRVGDEVTVKVLEIDAGRQRLSLSRRQAFRELEKENIRQYQKQEKEREGGSLFGAALKDALKKKD